MGRLKVSKNELIQYMITILRKNIEDYEDSLKTYYSKYEPIKIIE